MVHVGRLVTVLFGLCLAASWWAFCQDSTPSEEAALQAYRQGAFSRAVDLYTKALSETEDAGHRARLHVRIGWTLFALGRETEVETHLQAALLEDSDLVLVPDYYTQEFLDLFEAARRKALSGAGAGAQVPAPDLEATLAGIDERLASGSDLEGALADVDLLLAAYPEEGRLIPRRIEILERLGRTAEAEDMQSRLALADPATGLGITPPGTVSTPDLILRANRLLDEGDVDTSLELLREAVSRQPSNVAALELMAEAAQRAGRWQEAEFALKSALSLQPDNISLKLRLGEVSLAMDEVSAARDVFRELTARYPHSDRAWASLGLLDARLGIQDRALEELAKALAENPLLPEVQLASGELLLAKGETAAAMDALRSAANLLQDDPQLQARLGQALLAQGDIAQAVTHLRNASEGGYAPPDVQRAMVLGLIVSGLFSEAERALAGSAQHDSGDLAVLHGLLLLEKGSPGEAEAVLASLVESQPNDVPVLNLLAVALYRQGRYGEAIAYLARAYEIDPDHQGITRNLAHAQAAFDAEKLAARAQEVIPPPTKR
jgi:tetratricopeptide (TPR) repeat protein